jgi:probable HAF family extracellular repeat protein
VHPSSPWTLLVLVGTIACQSATDSPDSAQSFLLVDASVAPYEFVDLGTLGGQHSYAVDINNAGQVVGWAYNASGARRAFLWQDGVMQDLGTLGGDYFTSADDINEHGQVVGQSADAAGTVRPFLWSDGVMRDLDPGGQVPVYGPLLRVNDAGWVVWTGKIGLVYGRPKTRAFLFRDGASSELPTVGDSGESYVYAINNAGKAVGSSNGRAVLWEAGAVRDLIDGIAFDINARGQVVGASGDFGSPGSRAFFWNRGETTLIGPLPGDTWAQGVVINEAGEVGGISVLNTPDQSYVHGFHWQAGVLEPTSPTYQSEPNEQLFGMNVRGLAVGERGPGLGRRRPVAWEDGVTWNLPTGVSGATGRAMAVNTRGDVVGSVSTLTGLHAALWRRAPNLAASR